MPNVASSTTWTMKTRLDRRQTEPSNQSQGLSDDEETQRGLLPKVAKVVRPVLENFSLDQLISKKASTFGVIVAWFCMFLGICSDATIGPAFKLMKERHIPVILAASWRCQCMVLILIPLVLIEMKTSAVRPFSEQFRWIWGEENDEKRPGTARWATFTAGLGWAGNLLFWVVGLQFTTTVKAAIFNGAKPIIMMIYMWVFAKVELSKFEAAGAMVAFGGLLLAMLDQKADESAHEMRMEVLGYLLCLLSGASEVVCILSRQRTIGVVPLIQFTAATTLVIAVISSVLAITQLDSSFTVSDNGLFGWAADEWRVRMFVFAFLVGVVCGIGFNYAQLHLSPLVFASCLLMDPAVTGLISWAVSVEDIPKTFTILGGAVVVAGVALVIFGEHQRVASNNRSNMK